MTEFIEQLFSNIFGNNVILATILISIVPVIEVKGAIPFAMSVSIWKGFALNSMQALLFSLLGSCLIVPILALIYLPIINALKRSKLFKNLALKIEAKVNRSKTKIEDRVEKNNSVTLDNEPEEIKISQQKEINQSKLEIKDTSNNVKIQTQKNNIFKRSQPYNKTFFVKLISVFLFVSVPLPLTGVWTGTCVAVMLGLGFWWSCASVMLGNVVAGILVALVASIPGFDSIYIVYAVLIFVGVLLLISIIKKLINKKNKVNKS